MCVYFVLFICLLFYFGEIGFEEKVNPPPAIFAAFIPSIRQQHGVYDALDVCH